MNIARRRMFGSYTTTKFNPKLISVVRLAFEILFDIHN